MSGPQTRRHSFIPRFASGPGGSALPPPYEPSTGTRRNRRHRSQQPLPLYSTATALDLSRPGEESEHGASKVEHEFHLHSKGELAGRPWATLQLQARPPDTKQNHPIYHGGDPVQGDVKLDLARSQTITSVQLSVSEYGFPLSQVLSHDHDSFAGASSRVHLRRVTLPF